MEEVLLHSLLRETGKVLWLASFFAILWGIWSEKHNRIFREVERSGEEVWEVTRFNASLWVLVMWAFVNYELGLVLLD